MANQTSKQRYPQRFMRSAAFPVLVVFVVVWVIVRLATNSASWDALLVGVAVLIALESAYERGRLAGRANGS
jgi:uncharacterized membrane protein YdbT with pleckstrin-like domain